ncbi:DNA circularization protein [Ferrovibrio xuzhouensis]|uniref:DNA circularization protein n=1 Tax=Ferrovibrio xuzhouensis TaxID=1576914 RepID=A0ABV7VDG4_9PROT
MTWRDELQPARFRTAGFEVEAAERSGGRRLAKHEYPQQDIPYVEDLGRKAEGFRVTAYVIGESYKTARDALLAALREAGPGILVHPLHGQVSVAVDSWTQRETTDQGGMASFEIAFVEAGDQQYPQSSYDTAARVGMSSDAAMAAAGTDLANRLDTRGPGFLTQSAGDALRGALDKLNTLSSQMAPADAAAATRNLSGMTGDLDGLVSTGAGLSSRLTGVFSALRGLDPAGRIAGYRSLLGYGSGLPGASTSQPLDGTAWATASRQQEAANNLAIADAVQRMALIETTRAGAETDFATYDDAIAWRDDIGQRLDDASEVVASRSTGSDDMFTALTDLRTEALRDIDTRAVNKPALRKIQPPETMPATVLAYQLYGDATRADEIASRNGVAHPGFVPPEPLSVLSV